MIECPTCQNKLVKPDIGKTTNCTCGQSIYNHPKGYIIGLYKTCQVCKTIITDVVSFSQHFHDRCFAHSKTPIQKDKIIIVHELEVQ